MYLNYEKVKEIKENLKKMEVSGMDMKSILLLDCWEDNNIELVCMLWYGIQEEKNNLYFMMPKTADLMNYNFDLTEVVNDLKNIKLNKIMVQFW